MSDNTDIISHDGGSAAAASGGTGGKYRIALFCTVISLFWFAMYVYVPNLPVYSKSLGASYSLVGLILGSYGFAQMLLRIPLGIASDVLNKRKIFIQICTGFCILSGLLFWFFPNPVMLLISRTFAGIAASGWLMFSVLFSGYFKDSEVTKAMGIINAFLALGQVPGMLIGGIVAERAGMQYTFLISVIVALAAFILGFGIKEKPIEKEPMSVKQVLTAGKDPELLLYSILAILAQFIPYATVFGFTPLVARQLGADGFQVGLLATVYTAPSIVASFLSGSAFIRRIGERTSLVIGLVIIAITCILTPYSTNMTQLYILLVICGFARGVIFPLMMGMSVINLDIGKRATGMGFFQAIYSVGFFLGPVVAGILSDAFGFVPSFWAIGLIALFSAAFPIWSRPIMRRKS